jgi:BMFP domain-containing protein YqiC
MDGGSGRGGVRERDLRAWHERERTVTQTSNRLMDEFAKLMTDVAGVAQGVRREAETVARGQAERFMAGMDLVGREEFEAVRDIAVRARDENDALRARIEALEARLARAEEKPRRTAAKARPAEELQGAADDEV